MTRNRSIVRTVRSLIVIASFFSAQTALAQLASLGANPIQQELGRVIQAICPTGVIVPGSDLQTQCNAAVGAITGADLAGGRLVFQSMGTEELSSGLESITEFGAGIGAGVGVGGAGGVALAAANTRHAGITINGKTISWDKAFGNYGGVSAGGLGGGLWSFFVDGTFALSDRDGTALQTGFEADSVILRAGAEYGLGTSAVLGLALGYANHDADLDAGAGDVETDEYQVEVYANWFGTSGWYIDAGAGYGVGDIEQARNINYAIAGSGVVAQVASSETDSDTLWANVQIGYDALFAGWTVGPYGRLSLSHVTIDGFTESMSSPAAAGGGLATVIDRQETTLIPLTVGVRVAKSFPLGSGSLTPQAVIEGVVEFDNDNAPLSGRFVDDRSRTKFQLPTDDPDRLYGQLAVGASYTFSSTTSAHLIYQTLIGFEHLDTHAVLAGLRVDF